MMQSNLDILKTLTISSQLRLSKLKAWLGVLHKMTTRGMTIYLRSKPAASMGTNNWLLCWCFILIRRMCQFHALDRKRAWQLFMAFVCRLKNIYNVFRILENVVVMRKIGTFSLFLSLEKDWHKHTHTHNLSLSLSLISPLRSERDSQ